MLQRIFLKNQSVTGDKEYLFQSDFSRYPYHEKNEVTFLWSKLSALHIMLHIQWIWKPIIRHLSGTFIMEKFIDNGYVRTTLKIISNIMIYIKVVVLSYIIKHYGTIMIDSIV